MTGGANAAKPPREVFDVSHPPPLQAGKQDEILTLRCVDDPALGLWEPDIAPDSQVSQIAQCVLRGFARPHQGQGAELVAKGNHLQRRQAPLILLARAVADFLFRTCVRQG